MLDTDSMILTSGMCAALMAMVFFAMRRIPGMAPGGLYWWGLANAQFAAASALLVSQSVIGIALGIGLAGTLFIGGMAALVIGSREFFGLPRRPRLVGIAALLATLGLLYFTLLDSQALMRITLIGGYAALVLLDLARLCLPGACERIMRFPALVLGAVALAGAGLHAARAAQAGWMVAGGAPVLDPALLMHTVRLYSAFAMTALAVGFLMLAHARLRASLERQITHDALTGALSRTGFMEACEDMLKRADRLDRPMCLAFIDLDHFKTVNDVYGHVGGDRVLEHFAATTGRSIGNEHAFGRLGGEEFGLLYHNMALEDARLHSFRLRTEIERHGCPSDEHWIMYTVSIGLVERQRGESLSALLQRADAALYAAKAAGRNAVGVGRDNGETALVELGAPAL